MLGVMKRRHFVQLLGGALAARTLGRAAPESGLEVQTVRGPVAMAALGLVLPHEHVLVDFIGAGEVSPARYDREAVLAAVVPPLRAVRELGVRTVAECTPAYLGRDVRLLERASAETGLHLVTNTGLYGARQDKFLPGYAHTESAAQLAARWIAEDRDGIDSTTIRPGFIKCGVDPAPELSPTHRKLVEAAALTHRETGLTIAVHTGRGPGLAQLDLLGRLGVAPAAYVWVHAQNAPDDALFAAADRGAWLSFDGLNRPTLTRHLELCRAMKRRGHLDRVLLSHDAGWYDPAQSNGGTIRPYDLLLTVFRPMLEADGFTAAEITALLVTNPARALARRRRLA